VKPNWSSKPVLIQQAPLIQYTPPVELFLFAKSANLTPASTSSCLLSRSPSSKQEAWKQEAWLADSFCFSVLSWLFNRSNSSVAGGQMPSSWKCDPKSTNNQFLKSKSESFPEPVGLFCTHLEAFKCHVMRNIFAIWLTESVTANAIANTTQQMQHSRCNTA